MIKPASLRDHLTATTPDLKANPDKLSVMVGRGRLVMRYGDTLSFEYAYTVKLVILDFQGHADAIMVPLLAWLKRHQVDLFENPDKRDTAVRFEAELLNQSTVDLSIEVDLTEAVDVKPGEAPADPSTARRYVIIHRDEPGHVGVITEPIRYQAVLGDEILAEWTAEPPQDG